MSLMSVHVSNVCSCLYQYIVCTRYSREVSVVPKPLLIWVRVRVRARVRVRVRVKVRVRVRVGVIVVSVRVEKGIVRSQTSKP